MANYKQKFVNFGPETGHFKAKNPQTISTK
jgi:hypothetical protein